MKFLKFMGAFGKQKAHDMAQAIEQGIASWDPEAASEAEIQMMIEKFEDITGKVAGARAEYNREQQEADACQAAYDKKKAAAIKINAAIGETEDEADKAELTAALDELVAELEELKPELEREIQEAVEAKEILDELEQIAEVYSKKLKTAKQTLANAKRDMKKAEAREERAEEREKRAKELAGLKADTDELGSALNAFKRNADESNQKAEASELRSKLLAPTESKSKSVIDKFMDDTPAPSTASDRLANL